MKIRFISKKERENLKNQKEQSSHQTNEVNERLNNHLNSQKQEKKIKIEEEKPMISEHFVNQKSQFQTERERSRDIKPQLKEKISKMQTDEQTILKKKTFGVEKMQKAGRHNMQYRSQLLFEWDKKEDTSANYVPIIQTIKKPQKNKDVLLEQDFQTWKDKAYEKMDERDWRIFREDHQIYIKNGKAPSPFRRWQQLEKEGRLDHQLVKNLLSQKFIKPKPVQMQAITMGLNKRDLMAIAPTGQGKTLAYLIPLIQHLLSCERLDSNNMNQGPLALVLVPSRELAEQIYQQFKKVVDKGILNKIVPFIAVGGHQLQLQSIELQKGCDVMIGTPGRICELINKKYMVLNRVQWIVIDQADKMISENLVEEVEKIMEYADNSEDDRKNKVVHLFSATMIPEVEKLSKVYLRPSYLYMTIGEPGGGKKQIEQHVQLVSQEIKNQKLFRILKMLEGPLIIFVNTRQKCEKLYQIISKKLSRKVDIYHGGKNQQARQRVIFNFKSNKFEILVATDLAGRGLDVKGINAVINYDAPKNISEFIHRSGRTGRAGMKGKAYTLLTKDDEPLFYDIRVFLERNGFEIPQNLKKNVAAQVRPGSVNNTARKNQIVYTN